MAKVMVELWPGYGDGYGVVEAGEAGEPVAETRRVPTHYQDEAGNPTPMRIEEWKRKLLAGPNVALLDAGVSVPAGAVRRVIGPLDCPEALRVRAKRIVRNDREYCRLAAAIDAASDEEIVAAMTGQEYPDKWDAVRALAARQTPATA